MNNKQSREDILDQIKGKVKMLENTPVKDIDTLDVEYQLDSNLKLKEIILTLSTGGPRIDLKLNSYIILGYWGGEKVDYPIFEKKAKIRSAVDQLWYFYEEQFNILK